MPQFTSLTSRVIPLPENNVDTDQIIPARFLKVTDKVGLGENLFADWRYLTDGSPNPDFVINKVEHQGDHILLTGDNFGCGSSREHAPWALIGWGIQAVISTSFADIFRNNALKNGLLPVVVDPQSHHQLLSLVQEEPELVITIDLFDQVVILPDGRTISFPIDSFSKSCLLEGIDQLGFLLKLEPQITAYEQALTG